MIPLEKVTAVSRATLRYGIDGKDHVCLHEGTAYRKGNILHNAARYGFVFTREEAHTIKKQNEQARARALIENRKNAELWKKQRQERKKADEQFRSMLKDATMVAEVYRVRHETGLHDYEEESVLLYRSAQGQYALAYSFDPAPGGYGDKCIEQLSAFVDVDQAEDNKAIAAEVRDRTGFMTQLLKAL